MPTNRRRRLRTRVIGGVPDSVYQALTEGWIVDDDGHDWRFSHTEEEHRDAWEKHRDAIMARHAASYRAWGRLPGRRPWPFFRFDLEPAHPRLVVGKEMVHLPYGSGPVPKPDGKDVYESDAQYLLRLGLLYDWEKELLARKRTGRGDA